MGANFICFIINFILKTLVYIDRKPLKLLVQKKKRKGKHHSEVIKVLYKYQRNSLP